VVRPAIDEKEVGSMPVALDYPQRPDEELDATSSVRQENVFGTVAPSAKAVVVHGGARDSYQLALALSEAGLLDSLITDLFWPTDRTWANLLAGMLPPSVRALLLQRNCGGLPFEEVRLCLFNGLRCLLLEKMPHVPFSLRRRSIRAADAALGRAAGKRAAKAQAGLVSYSYFGFDAIRQYGRPAMLFQVHPHPATVRRILYRELEDHPDCADSLRQEWELALPEKDYQHLVSETKMASYYLTASTFTRNSLIEHGTPASSIAVVPYGVDLEKFHPSRESVATKVDSRLHLLFVGRINQRKGIKYLLNALKLLNTKEVRLTICGRVVDDLDLFRPFASQVEVRPSVSASELVAAYQTADLFVFPSVAEGFGQVLLEAMSCGLPILSTTHTAAPDLIEDGIEGFIVEPRRADLLAEHMAWACDHRSDLASMGRRARLRAERFTWSRFRADAAKAVGRYLGTQFTHGTIS
jgi:glycosyltransferase involved in cell wall biosynthesis